MIDDKSAGIEYFTIGDASFYGNGNDTDLLSSLSKTLDDDKEAF